MPISGGTPVRLASSQLYLSAIAVNSKNLYWANEGSAPDFVEGAILSMPINGSDVTAAFAPGQFEPEGIAVDSNSVYLHSARHDRAHA
jgi:hypothetical protein